MFSNKAKTNPLHKTLSSYVSQLKDKVKSGFGFLSGLSTHPDVKKYTDLAQNIYGHAKNAYDTVNNAYDHFQKNKDNYQNQANNLIDQAHGIAAPFVDAYSKFKTNA